MLASLVLSLAVASVAAASSPAAATVAANSSDADVPYLLPEVVQLTDTVISALANETDVAEYAQLFAFGDVDPTNATAAQALRSRQSRCKTYLGDPLWPSKLVWDIFDLLLGGALEPIVPLASVCYPSSQYNNYDAAKCDYVITNWAKESLQ